MKRGWVKLWRKTEDNQIWLHDRTAWFVFEYLLLKADHKTGQLNKAMRTISEYLEIPLSTLHKAVSRLKNAKMVNTQATELYTIFTILNWADYQGDGERKVNAKGTQSEHIKELKNKELYKYLHLKISEEEYNQLKEIFPLKNVQGECDKANDWLANSVKRYKDFPAFMRNWLRKCPDVKSKPQVWTPPVNPEGLKKLAAIRRNFGTHNPN